MGAWSAGRRERRAGAPYSPEVREAARVRIEGSRVTMERIGLALGVSRETLYRWQKCYRWRRPAPPDKGGPSYYRSRGLGRPYGADAVGTARDLVTGSTLPGRRIAARAGICRATLYRWMKRPGWTRHAVLAATASGATGGAGAVGRRYRPPYGTAVRADARTLYETTTLPTQLVAARVGATLERVRHWARTEGWTRPR